jgi:hypothetical protein
MCFTSSTQRPQPITQVIRIHEANRMAAAYGKLCAGPEFSNQRTTARMAPGSTIPLCQTTTSRAAPSFAALRLLRPFRTPESWEPTIAFNLRLSAAASEASATWATSSKL